MPNEWLLLSAPVVLAILAMLGVTGCELSSIGTASGMYFNYPAGLKTAVDVIDIEYQVNVADVAATMHDKISNDKLNNKGASLWTSAGTVDHSNSDSVACICKVTMKLQPGESTATVFHLDSGPQNVPDETFSITFLLVQKTGGGFGLTSFVDSDPDSGPF
jgi:hypothetical protein